MQESRKPNALKLYNLCAFFYVTYMFAIIKIAITFNTLTLLTIGFPAKLT